jgi:hypothetical protein
MEEVLAGLGLLEHLPACRVHEMDVGVRVQPAALCRGSLALCQFSVCCSVLSVCRWLGVVADALALSTVADLEEVGITGAAAVSIAGFFGNLDDVESVEPDPEPEPQPQPQPQPLSEPEPDELEPAAEPAAEPPSGPMAAFDEVAVLAWLGTVPGLTAAEQAATVEMIAEDEYDGSDLAVVKAKMLRRLLKGTEAEGAVPLLLAARDAHLAAAAEETAAAATAAAEAAGPLAPPDEFVCAISQQLMVDPVTADEGVAATLDCHRLFMHRDSLYNDFLHNDDFGPVQSHRPARPGHHRRRPDLRAGGHRDLVGWLEYS